MSTLGQQQELLRAEHEGLVCRVKSVTCPEALTWQYAFALYLMRNRVYPASACRHAAPF